MAGHPRTASEVTGTSCRIDFDRPSDESLGVQLSGSWTLESRLPPAASVFDRLESESQIRRVEFNTEELAGWDSGLLTFLIKIIDECNRRQIGADRAGLPEGVRRLLDLASAVPEKKGARKETVRASLLVRTGRGAIDAFDSGMQMLGFIGEALLAFLKLLRGKARFRRSDSALTIQDCGAQALPIATLISALVGLILAFVGAVQLKQFGAQIFVADLVGLAMTREMAPMMTGIILAGRTGAAFAAQLGTMTVNEEIDALETMAISPMEFLVLPRMLALALMMPLLCLYADLVGILGGAVVGIGMLGLSPTEYFIQTQGAIGLNDIAVGIAKGSVFGVLVALSGCLRGMQCGRSASAVGSATTSAVVTAIVAIIVSDAIFAVATDVLGI